MNNVKLYPEKVNISVFITILLSLLVTTSSLVIISVNINSENKIILFGWLGYIVLLWGIIAFYKIKKSNINLYTFFFIIYMLFSYGQILLYALGIQHPRYDLISDYSNTEILSYCSYFILSTVFFLNGSIIAIRKDRKLVKNEVKRKERDSKVNQSFNKTVKVVSWFFFLISSPVYLYNLLSNIITSIQYGYGALYGYDDPNFQASNSSFLNIFNSFGNWFIPSLLFLLVLYKKNKKFKYFFTFMIIAVIGGNFMTGGRGGAMILTLAVLFLWDSEIKRFGKRRKIFLVLFLIIIISMLPVIAVYRGLANKSIASLVIAITNNESENLIVDVVAELGGSMGPWLMVNRLIPQSMNFKLGQSYIASFLAVIPSILLGGYSFTKYANLSQWLMDTLNMSYGPGFSMHAESFYNFGWFGIPFMFLIGWFYYKLISNNFIKGPMARYKNVLSTISFYMFAMNIRGSMYLTIRNEVYFLLLPITIIYLLYNTEKKKIEI
ncbi:O-antigen polysaccharide polymerase Wzy [Aerococcus urinaeequi]|uniref:O-antigen polysaccharide polymerase Wzy n=1 Tax=Aerococcus urinaeequi TaxID=51665 RepID=UPI003ED8ADDF